MSKIYYRIVSLILQASQIAKSMGIVNLLQPGLVKEMIIADILGHKIIHSKRDADAHSLENPKTKFEYLSCVEGGSGQLDRMFKSPPNKREASLKRITRNHKIYLAIFYKNEPLKVKVIYEIKTNILLKETERQLDKSSNSISHVGFSENWAKENGILISSKK